MRQQSRYRVDLAAQQAACEANYLRLMKLLPALSSMDSCEFGVMGSGVTQTEHGQRVRVTITEHCKYTTILDVHTVRDQNPWLPGPRFSVRVYHDARLAEVVACQQHRRAQPWYDYPNRQMFQRDEKAQWNQLLGEWLSHCLRHGHVLDLPADAASYGSTE